MYQQQTNTIRMMYSGNLKNISCAIDAKYEDFIESAIERFGIPAEFKDCIQITDKYKHVFKEKTFEYYITSYPNLKNIFYVRVDYSGLLDKEQSGSRRPLSKLNNKRNIRDEDEQDMSPLLTRQNCFCGVYPGILLSPEFDEPKAKKPKTDIVKKKAKVALTKIRL